MHTLLASLTLCLAGAAPQGPALIVDVDINDEVYIRPKVMTEADVDELVGQLHENGCTVLLVRAGFLGILPYYTDLSYPMKFDGDHARIHAYPGLKDMDEFVKTRTAMLERYAKFMEECNPPEAFIRAAHKRGMKAVVWIDMFDNFYPGYRSKFLDENPECRWTAKDGYTTFRGLVSYAFPEARTFCLAQARELLALGADGIHCSTSAHCRHLPNSHTLNFYGYEQPVVGAFKERYGVDVRTADEFDEEAWHDVKGEFMVQLYRELGELCHAGGKELWVGLQLGRYTQFCVDSHFSANAVVQYSNHWKTLVDEGIADAFIVGDYELVSQPNTATWSRKTDIVREPGEDLFQWAAREYQDYCKGKVELYLFSEWLPGSEEALEHRLNGWAKATVDNGFDGIDIHEAMNSESPEKMAVLKRFSEKLRGGQAE
ncbi:MAG: hypothetical protein GY851_25835 [bacterium]|nr:hypothetical protein [bacterium]